MAKQYKDIDLHGKLALKNLEALEKRVHTIISDEYDVDVSHSMHHLIDLSGAPTSVAITFSGSSEQSLGIYVTIKQHATTVCTVTFTNSDIPTFSGVVGSQKIYEVLLVDGTYMTTGSGGSGGGTAISGTSGKLSKFNNDGNNIEDSSISDDGSEVLIESPVQLDSLVPNTSGLKFTNLKNNEASTTFGDSSLFGSTVSSPNGVTMGWDGNIYTCNVGDDTVSKIEPNGTTTVFASTGSYPRRIVMDFEINLYVVNMNDNTVTKITPTGDVSTFSTGTTPHDIVFDAIGGDDVELYISNFDDNTVTKVSALGVSTVFGTTGYNPSAIAIDSSKNIYTADTGDNTITKITPLEVSTVFSTSVNSPSDIVIDSSNNLYVTNLGDNTVTKITSAGDSSVFATTGNGPSSIVIDGLNNLYVTNSTDATVTKITPAGESFVFATTGNGPSSIVKDIYSNDTFYVANLVSNNVTKITSAILKRMLTLDEDGNVIKHDATAITSINNVSPTPNGNMSINLDFASPTDITLQKIVDALSKTGIVDSGNSEIQLLEGSANNRIFVLRLSNGTLLSGFFATNNIARIFNQNATQAGIFDVTGGSVTITQQTVGVGSTVVSFEAAIGTTSIKFPAFASGSYIVSVAKTYTDTTTVAKSSAALTTAYPLAKTGDKVQCMSIIAGALIYEKTASGWCKYNVDIVA